MPPPPELSIGDLVGRKYRLDDRLGEGGMATVFRATNVTLGVEVAVKVLKAENAADPRTLARFRQEAHVTASIAHENVIRVYDYGVTPNGAPYIVMELLRGETLHARLERGPLAPADAARIVMRAMKGVIVAHEKGILHRDLKPENVFLARGEHRGERPIVLDFGVSFLAHASGPPITRVTKAGSVIGTAAYLPPESIRGGGKADHRVDVWALGVVLYEALSGTLPFAATSYHALLAAIAGPAPAASLVGVVKGLDAELDGIVQRALAKDVDARTPSVRALFDELAAWLERREGPESAPTRDPLDDEGPTIVGPAKGALKIAVGKPPKPKSAPIRTPWIAFVTVGVLAFAIGSGFATFVFAPRSEVAITFDQLPPGAIVRLNGAATTPPLRVSRGQPAAVRVEAPGYPAWEAQLTPEGDLRVTVPPASGPKPPSSR